MFGLLHRLTNVLTTALTVVHRVCTAIVPRGYYCYELTEGSRRRLLEKFPPRFAIVEAHHITHEYDVPATTAGPDVPVEIEVIGYVSDDSLECVAVTVDGHMHRPDGRLYHVTLSRERHRAAKESNDLLTQAGWKRMSGFFLAAHPAFRLIRK